MAYRLDPSQRRRGESPVIMAPNVLTPDQCLKVVELGSALPAIDGRVDEASVDRSIRVSTIRWIPQQAAFVSLYEAVAGAIFALNQHFFGFDLTTIEDMQFTTYSETTMGFYDWHVDCGISTPDDMARKLSLTIQLSDPADYEGGELELWCATDPVFARKEWGLGAVFPAPTLHRVRPVTRGQRHSLVAWASGPRFR
jgi:PKHD-type hydroxylase